MKYFAHKVRTDEGDFDSAKEYHRFQELKLEQKSGTISCLRRQLRLQILPQITYQVIKHLKTKTRTETRVDEKAKHYTADFGYYDNQAQCYVLEEVKSYATALARDYPIRRHLAKIKINLHNERRPRHKWIYREIK